MKFLSLAAFMAFILLGCGSGTGNNQESVQKSGQKMSPSPVLENEVPLADRVYRAKYARLHCADRVCHPNTVMLSGVSSNGVARCSGVLISPNQVLTNDHCLHQPLSIGRGSCEGVLFVHTLYGESLRCESVLYHSKESGVDSEDYAVIQLKDTASRFTPLKFSGRGLKNGESVHLDRVQMYIASDGSFDGQVQGIQCEARHRTLLYPAVNSADFPFMTFASCPIQAGNSGAPIFNQAGELTAILQGFFDIPDEVFQKPEIKGSGKKPRDFRVSVATQSHCMKGLSVLGASHQSSPSCREVERALIQL